MRALLPAAPLALALAAAVAAPEAAPRAAADDRLASLLAGIGRSAKPAGEVTVSAWTERGRAGVAELVVRLEARGAAKLVAEPGVTVVPVAREGVTWPRGDATSDAAAAGQAYFDAPVELRLPFEAGDARPVEAGVAYAYCLVDYQCLFGEARVSALPLPACVAEAAAAAC